jgi:hypothetical protein
MDPKERHPLERPTTYCEGDEILINRNGGEEFEKWTVSRSNGMTIRLKSRGKPKNFEILSIINISELKRNKSQYV